MNIRFEYGILESSIDFRTALARLLSDGATYCERESPRYHPSATFVSLGRVPQPPSLTLSAQRQRRAQGGSRCTHTNSVLTCLHLHKK